MPNTSNQRSPAAIVCLSFYQFLRVFFCFFFYYFICIVADFYLTEMMSCFYPVSNANGSHDYGIRIEIEAVYRAGWTFNRNATRLEIDRLAICHFFYLFLLFYICLYLPKTECRIKLETTNGFGKRPAMTDTIRNDRN